MAIIGQTIKDQYAAYNGDCLEVLPTIPDGIIHLSVYSPPFCGLYQYSSSERDMSNCRSYNEFFEHYGRASQCQGDALRFIAWMSQHRERAARI